MFFFLLLFFYIIFMSLAIYKRKLPYQERGRGDRFFTYSTMGILLVFTCLRGIDVGNDTRSYYYIFKFAANQSANKGMTSERIAWLTNMEPGYRVLEKIVSLITDNYQLFIGIVAIIAYFSVIKFINYYSSNVAISSLLFYLLFWGSYVNLLRQILALSIVLFALYELNKSHKILFCVLVLCAATFHWSALFALGYLLLLHFRPTRKNKVILIVMAIILGIFGQIINVMSLVGLVSNYTNVESGMSIYVEVLRNLLICLFVWFMKHELVDDQERYLPHEKVMNVQIEDWIPVVCLALSIVAIGLPIITRVELYYSIVYIIVLPKFFAMKWSIERNKGVVLWSIFSILIAITIGTIIYRPEWVTEYHYQFFWNNHV